MVHRPLDEAVAHEFPAASSAAAAARYVLQTEPLIARVAFKPNFLRTSTKAPETHPHAVFVPGPVRQVGLQRLTMQAGG